jgi:hypothetical protein
MRECEGRGDIEGNIECCTESKCFSESMARLTSIVCQSFQQAVYPGRANFNDKQS